MIHIQRADNVAETNKILWWGDKYAKNGKYMQVIISIVSRRVLETD